MIITYTYNDEDKAELGKATRALSADKAFDMLYEIEQSIRKHFKYNEVADPTVLLNQIRDSIHESNLLELYD